MSEWMIQDFAKVNKLRCVILRYFNVAGADSSGKLGQRSPNATHLIRMACDAALGRRPSLKIFGTDFPTPDGSAIRDFINIEDLASAHLSALQYLEAGNNSQVLDCGYSREYSVREVAQCVQKLSNNNFVLVEAGKRLGDPACVTASMEKIQGTLYWNLTYESIDDIIMSSINWEKNLHRSKVNE